MNKKLIALCTISLALGAGYWLYMKSDYGRIKKASSIIERIQENKLKKNMKWEFPKTLIVACRDNLKMFTYGQLELIEDYVKDWLRENHYDVIKKHRALLLKEGIDWTRDITHLEDMLSNVQFISEGYTETVNRGIAGNINH